MRLFDSYREQFLQDREGEGGRREKAIDKVRLREREIEREKQRYTETERNSMR